MTAEEAVDAVLAEAARYLAVREVPPGSNRGVTIDYWVEECGLDPKTGPAWCAAFFGQVGRQALGHQWPCPRTAAVDDPARRWVSLVQWAKDTGCLLEYGARGDGIVLWHADLERFAHVGFVETITPSTVGTIEGNSNPAGGREGYGVFRLTRTPPPMTRYIHWSAALTGE